MRSLLHLTLATLLLFSLSLANAADLQEIEQELSDSVITTKITAKFTKNKNLNPLKISVSTVDGKVFLSGTVINKAAFVKALRLAKTTKGVKAVDADALDIKVVNSSFTDAYITAKVEAAVLKAKVFDDESIPLVGINAKTDNGVVTLSGGLENDKAIVAILKRVNAVRGIKKIVSLLKVDTAASA